MSNQGGVDTKFCRGCGDEIRANAEMCPECGYRTDPPTKEPSGSRYAGSGAPVRPEDAAITTEYKLVAALYLTGVLVFVVPLFDGSRSAGITVMVLSAGPIFLDLKDFELPLGGFGPLAWAVLTVLVAPITVLAYLGKRY